MILQSLVQYYEALESKGRITRPGWCRAKVSFALRISESGELLDVIRLTNDVEIRQKKGGIKIIKEPQLLIVPEMVTTRTIKVTANFLCDNTSYILGVDNKGKPARSRECFNCAKEKHLELLDSVDSAAAKAVKNYFQNWNPETAMDNAALNDYLDEMMSGGNLIFDIANFGYAHEDKAIREAWERHLERAEADGEDAGTCLITGRRSKIARIHGNIRGVRGAQSSGASLVSFNDPSFESYEKKQSFNAPISTYAAYAYTTALNHLISDSQHSTVIGDATIVYWSEDGNEEYQDIFSAVTEPKEDNYEIVDGVFKKLEAGRAVDVGNVIDDISMDKRFYILAIAPNAARLAIRFFYQDSFEKILGHLKDHYDRMEIARPEWETSKRKYIGAWQMLQETVNKKSKDKKPVSSMASSVLRAMISGGKYPETLYLNTLGRIYAEQDDEESKISKITSGRAAIIKAYLLRNKNYDKEEIPMGLNVACDNVAYVLGRTFSVLEAIQEDSNDNRNDKKNEKRKKSINSTIKDRYFNAACATPASIFPVLFKLKNSHIRKIDSPNMVIHYEKLLTELQSKVPAAEHQCAAYPKRLSLEEQGMFVLGYYHQNEKRYEKRSKDSDNKSNENKGQEAE